MKRLVTLFGIALLSLLTRVHAEAPVIDSLMVQDEFIHLSYHLEPVLDENTVQSLKRGAITSLTHHVQVWQDRPLVNTVVQEYIYPIQLSYDNWEHKFRIQMPGEERLTSNLKTIQEKCTQMQQIELVSVSDLEPDAEYCITIRVKFTPLSVDTYDAIREVLPESDQSNRKQSRGSIWRTALNLLGLGDKTFSLKTKNFKLTPQNEIQYVE